ncbi:DegV family protein [Salinibacillus xinjiangensis]|uniref:DegV family EDD domain-containing protein n=1 Tax=Salinibacillus xinjiangensis TaxID=1229268 RepID=A0A6G1X809_9BACI|nr:DegV family protein [Salinibacillus xinjiangensis]MRG87046.1 DegV family EDD domain-containing protein [Salinibacillus xinjiangensis]
MHVKIVTDSACDLPKSIYKDYDIDMAPLLVHLNNQDYYDGKTIEPKTVYDAMKEGAAPKTSQVSPEAFLDIFTSYVEQDQPCVYIGFSSELSGTFQSATIARQQILDDHPDAKLYVVDTKCASLGQGLVAMRAAQLAKEGAEVEKIVETAEYHAKHMEHIFTVDDLEYLQRGGRVSKAAAFFGGLLQIKPLLHVEDGKLIPLEKIRGTKKVLKRMFELMELRAHDINNQTVAISHADDLQTAEKLAAMINDKYEPKEIIVSNIGAAIGAHAGPCTISLFFLNNTHV